MDETVPMRNHYQPPPHPGSPLTAPSLVLRWDVPRAQRGCSSLRLHFLTAGSGKASLTQIPTLENVGDKI